MSLTLAEARASFPALRDLTFLDAACVSLIAQPTADAISSFLEMCLHPTAEDASIHHTNMDALRESAMVEGAKLLNADQREIALVESTTHGLNIAANSLPLQAGDKVLIADTEFLQVAIPWKMKEKSVGIELQPVASHDEGVLTVEDFERAMDDKAKVVCVSSVQWSSGYRLDLKALGELCRSRGVYLVVDSIQELGACKIDVKATPVDFLVAGGHKWLNAPFGCGLMYISNEMIDTLEPSSFGYLAVVDPPRGWPEYFRTPSITPYSEWEFLPTAKRFEIAGTSNYPGAIGLGASLKQINDVGIDVIHEHVLKLTDLLHDELNKLGMHVVSKREPREVRSGITVFRCAEPVEDNLALLNKLLAKKIYVAMRYTSGVGGIRVSTHYFNNEEDILRLAEGIKASL